MNDPGIPAEIQAAAEQLADWGADTAAAWHREHHDGDEMSEPTREQLRDYMVGAVLVQVTDPDYEGAAEAYGE